MLQTRARDPAGGARRAALAHLAAGGRRRARRDDRRRRGCPSCRACGGGSRSAGWCSSARSAGWGRPCSSRGRCCGGIDAGPVPARRVDAPAALVRRVVGRRGRRREPVVRAVDRRVRAGARRDGRQERRPARAAAGHGPAHARQRLRGRARGGPARALARRRRAARGPRADRQARDRRDAQHARAGHPRRARGPRSRPGPPCSTSVPPGELWVGLAGRVRRAGAPALAARPRAARPALGGRLRGDRRRARGPARGRRRVRAARRRPRAAGARRRWRDAAVDALRAVPLGARHHGRRARRRHARRRAAARRSGCARATTRCAAGPGWQIWATLRLMDDARTTLFPLYSSMATPAVAAGARRGHRPRRRGVDRADDPVDDRPSATARSSPTTPSSARTSWGTAGCASSAARSASARSSATRG